MLKFYGGVFKGVKGERGRWTMGDKASARIGNPDNMVFNSKNEVIIYDPDAHRFAKLTGNKVVHYSGSSDMSAIEQGITFGADVKTDKDGDAKTAQYASGMQEMQIDANDTIWIKTANILRKLSPNGSVSTVFTYTPKGKEVEN